MSCRSSHVIKLKLSSQLIGQFGHVTASASCKQPEKHGTLGHVNKINCFSSFCLQKFGEGGGYLLFIFRGQRSYATIFTGVKLGYKRRVKGKTQVKKE